jgi:hypothetical protein
MPHGKGKIHPKICHESKERKHRYSSSLSSTSALDFGGGERHNPADMPPGITGYHYVEGKVDCTASLDRSGISRPHRYSIPGASSPQRVYTDWAIPTHQLIPYREIIATCSAIHQMTSTDTVARLEFLDMKRGGIYTILILSIPRVRDQQYSFIFGVKTVSHTK